MEFTIVDAGVAVIALLSGALAYSRGFTREMFALAGWVGAAAAAYYIAPMLEPLIREAPLVGSYLAASCVISMVAAFTIVVAAALLILSMFTPLVSGLVLESMLAPIDRLLGFVFGLFRGLVLIAVVFLIYTNLSGVEPWPPLDNAASRTVFEDAAASLEQSLPDSIPDWFGQRIDALMVNCGDQLPAVTSPGAGDVDAGTTGAGTTDTGTTDTGTTGTGTTDTGTTDTGTTGTTGN
jgi:membrane protein required for colicin V production